MRETKRCPYCGEEILAVAKKCKHCGEWLEEKKEEPKKQVPCEVCGEMIDEDTLECPYCHEEVVSSNDLDLCDTYDEMTFIDSDRSSKSKPASDTIKDYEYVDLGLSVKWATCNIGADYPSDYGDYFAWGETESKSGYADENSVTYRRNMGSIAGDPRYDAARANWGGTWRLPTVDEIKELTDMCEWKRTTYGGTKGYKVIGPNGNSIFLPAAGVRFNFRLRFAGKMGCYWSATPKKNNADKAYYLYFGCSFFFSGRGSDSTDRGDGQSVRPVSE